MRLLTSIDTIGCIINVSSLMATKAGLGVTAYAASKAGIVGTSCFPSHHSSFLHAHLHRIKEKGGKKKRGKKQKPSLITRYPIIHSEGESKAKSSQTL